MTKILVVEDQEDLLKGLQVNLNTEGYEVIKASTGEAGLKLALSQEPDLVLLDLLLPGMSGLDVCRELRQRGFQRPIIMLTAKGDEIDRVLGLEIGADDYVTKPFGLRELLARIRVRLRRQPFVAPKVPSSYEFGNIFIDFEHMRASAAGQEVMMTAKEYDLMRIFVRHKGEVLSREQILAEIWGKETHVSSRTVDAHILKLRHKLERNPAEPQYILTIYGMGYKFVD